MRRVAGVPDVVVGQGQLIFEHSIALIIAGSDSGAEFVVPYADVESLSFSEPDLQVSRRPFTRKAVPATSVELAWQSGRITLLHNGASPATCLDRYAVVYRRIDAARAAARAAAGDPAPDTSDLVGSLKELSLMHESGALTADEFATAKARLLGIAPEVGEGSHEE
jgi:hypothetical protein